MWNIEEKNERENRVAYQRNFEIRKKSGMSYSSRCLARKRPEHFCPASAQRPGKLTVQSYYRVDDRRGKTRFYVYGVCKVRGYEIPSRCDFKVSSVTR